MELKTIAILSTSHITAEINDVLTQKNENSVEIEDSEHWVNSLTWAYFDYGYLLCISGENFDPESEFYNRDKNIPECIMEVAQYCKKRGASWVCFDGDAMEAEGLATYIW